MKSVVAAVLLVGVALGTPDLINKSEPSKRCPAGFTKHDGDCRKVFTESPQKTCGTGEFHHDGRCAVFAQKRATCAEGFTDDGSRCVREVVTPASVTCPAGYEYQEKEMDCLRRVIVGSGHGTCAAGSVMKGDKCFRTIEEEPKEVCAEGFKMEDRLCIEEVVFDCTPSREHANLDPLKPCSVQLSPGLRASILSSNNALRKSKIATVGGWTKSGSSGTPPKWQEEYIFSKTCKRVSVEHPRKICHRGTLKGKSCFVEVEVPVIPPEPYELDHRVPSKVECCPGFTSKRQTATKPVPVPRPSGCSDICHQKEVCYAVEYKAHGFECPKGHEDIGDKCAIFTPLKHVCPAGFKLVDETCTKTEVAPLIVEYIVKYRCTGKECEQESRK